METATDLRAAHELTIERRFAAPPALVWRIWEDRDHLIRWWGPKGFVCTALDWDFRVGGDWSASMRSDAHGEVHMRGRFREIAPQKRIVFTFNWASGGPDPNSVVTVGFAPAGEGTLLTFHHGPFATVEARDDHLGGWTEFVEAGQAYAEALAREGAR